MTLFLKIHLNIILSSTPSVSIGLFPSFFPNLRPYAISFSPVCEIYLSSTFISSLLYYPLCITNHELLFMQFSPSSLSLSHSKHILHYPFVENRCSPFVLQCDRPCFAHIQLDSSNIYAPNDI